ncbi:carbohydrate binding domain-containing protein [Paenibacillus sp. MMS18-CY102]|uniref:carbohydrate binding domain-containing protein n=1 Tax=Paenibacillus sp. MMS18-CY102 TaxID=2682849 RepID=UPI0013667134|nr:carbohydrate binding domain-containing protein [Paenibacillus sp. MMS18-CY102]MWC30933.1 starch-binding protein [Paenibacillus sp. MMS18-CY102]
MVKVKRSFHAFLSLMLFISVIGTLSFTSVQRAEAAELQDKPFSWDNANVYFVLTDRFNNGNTSNDNSYGRTSKDAWGTDVGTFHGGDIKGLTKKLQEGYFTELGTNAIWISAPWEQMHGWVGGKDGDFAHYGYHGYYGLDFTSMDKNMGTIEEMREFVDLAHTKGIRVILDVIMNHTAYPTLKDMADFHYGDMGGLTGTWAPDKSKGQNFHTHNEIMNTQNATAWASWWGKDWIRASNIAGYDNCGGGDLTMCVGFLPDIKTESTGGVALPPLLKNKWAAESTGFDNWIVPAAKQYRKDLNIAPKDYMVKWLSSWVEEFGIDGFRADTAKHIETNRWAQLKTEASAALQKWRQNNPTKPGAQWKDNFWMTAEVFGHGLGRSSYFDNGFDSVINFSFQTSTMTDLEGLFSRYATELNGSTPNYNMLSYLSSHDTSLYDRNNLIQAGTAMLLLPGGVQTFYGDETARQLGNGGSDPQQGTRSDMNWNSINQNVLSHWQKIGKFRNNHIAVGAGAHKKLADGPYTFARTYEKDGLMDKVVVAAGASGTVDVTVAGIFEDGEAVRDAYTGAETVVAGGKARFTAGTNGLILIESVKGMVVGLPQLSATPAGGKFKTDTQSITLQVTGATTGKYTLDGSDPATGTAFANGDSITIGANMAFNDTLTLRLYAENDKGTNKTSYTFTKADPNAKLQVYFKKPADWGTPQVYFYETLPKQTEPLWASAPAMESAGGDWYVYTFDTAEKATIIFKDSTNKQLPAKNLAGFTRTSTGWFDGSTWSDTDPRGQITKPTAPANLTASAKTATTVSLTWTASTDSVPISGYDVYRNQVKVGTASGTTYSDTGLTQATQYLYKVIAKNSSGGSSDPSNELSVTTLQGGTESAVTIYYKKGFATPYIHYRVEGGTWTTAPGAKMADSEIAGYAKFTINTTSRVEAAFNNGSGSWDSNATKNYFFNQGDNTYTPGANGAAGTIVAGKPGLPPEGNKVTVYYKQGFNPGYIHYRPEGGAWTTSPGVKMENDAANPGYSKITIDIGTATRMEACFNNGSGSWDSNSSKNYFFAIGDNTFVPGANGAAGTVTPGKPGLPPVGNKVTVYYKQGFNPANIHYRPEGGTWTAVPGVKMENDPANVGYSKITIDIGSATRLEACFNNGSGTWDNNAAKNYFFNVGNNTYTPGANNAPGKVELGVAPGDTTPPSVPGSVNAAVNTGTPKSVTLTWSASNDNLAVVGYEILRTSGTDAPVKFTVGNVLTYTDSTVVVGKTYQYQVRALDAAGNVSSYSAAATAIILGDSVVDTVAPTKPTGVAGTPAPTSVALNWTASTDAVGVTGYEIYRDGVKKGTSATVSYTDTGLTPETSYIYTVKAYDLAGNLSDASDAITAVTPKQPVVQPGGSKPYSTNPTFGKRVSTPMVIDGVNGGQWTSDMLIAIDMAGDDPRSLGSNWAMHETPMDLTHLWAAWDDQNLYLAWQYVDVTDIIDPANAGSSGGTPIRSMDLPQTIAIDTIAGAGASIDMWKKNGGKPIWGGTNLPDYQFNIASKMYHTGYLSKAINGVFPVDDGGINYKTGAQAGIEVKFAAGNGSSTLWGVKDADDVAKASALVDFIALGHNVNRDTFYEAKIPLSAIGNPNIEANGIGVMLHQGEFSPMDTLPNDPATSNTPGVSESNSPLEWADIDLLTVPFARIGR